MSILIAEDETRIASFLDKGLRAQGFPTQIVGDGRSAVDAALSGGHDLLLLDVGLPVFDGFEVLKRVRSVDTTLPIIMLTARTSGADAVAGLTGGADDYVPKPFRFDELLARIRLRMLRPETAAAAPRLSHNGVTLDLRARRIEADGQRTELSSREFALAEQLLRNAGEIVSREHLLRTVWGYTFDPGSNVVDVYVRYLRAKIGADRIETVRGQGYRLA